MDRAHRIGQKRVVNVYRLITRGTLEEKIMRWVGGRDGADEENINAFFQQKSRNLISCVAYFNAILFAFNHELL